jgi:uncharacterized protein (TIGR02996 family)
MMTNTLSFLVAIAAHPGNEDLRLVFADWLEDNDDWRAEFLRLDCTLRALPPDGPRPTDLQNRWLELRSRLSPSWLTILGRSALENCENRFLFQCPERWDRLAPTKVAAVRFCQACRERVYYCSTIEEAKEHAGQGHCIAVNESVARLPGDLVDFFSNDRLTLGLIDPEDR